MRRKKTAFKKLKKKKLFLKLFTNLPFVLFSNV